jgi:hypothetical protein
MGLFGSPDTAATLKARQGVTNADGSFNMGGADGKGRRMTANSEIIGTAVTRADYAQAQKDALIPAPPPTDPNRIGDARAAAERQRKRATSGSGIAGSGMSSGGPGARLAPASLIGGY